MIRYSRFWLGVHPGGRERINLGAENSVLSTQSRLFFRDEELIFLFNRMFVQSCLVLLLIFFDTAPWASWKKTTVRLVYSLNLTGLFFVFFVDLREFSFFLRGTLDRSSSRCIFYVSAREIGAHFFLSLESFLRQPPNIFFSLSLANGWSSWVKAHFDAFFIWEGK